MFELTEQDRDSEILKLTTKKVLEDFNILELERDDGGLFYAKINDENGFYSVLKLFFSLYLLEKLYSQRYPISVEGLESKELKEELKRNLRSAIPKHSQAYFLNFGGKVVFVTYFGYHGEHVNLFRKPRILAGDFIKLFESGIRPKYVKTSDSCPIILAFKYHIAERYHIIKKEMPCKVNIEFGELKCDRSNNECSCLKIIEKAILEDSENRECNLRILGGVQIFFDIDYELVKRLISLEGPEGELSNDPFKNMGYEPIFNFLLGCYISDKLNSKFNSNIKLRFDGVEKQIDIIFFSKSGTTLIETTREHAVCSKDEYFKKIEKSILTSIPLQASINQKQNFKLILVSLTPENKFTRCTHYVNFARGLFNFQHVGIPDDEKVIEFIEGAKYFSPANTDKILRYQLRKLVEYGLS